MKIELALVRVLAKNTLKWLHVYTIDSMALRAFSMIINVVHFCTLPSPQ